MVDFAREEALLRGILGEGLDKKHDRPYHASILCPREGRPGGRNPRPGFFMPFFEAR
jgi:hypothetical protein